MKDIKEKATRVSDFANPNTLVIRLDIVETLLAKQKEEILGKLPKEKTKVRKPHLTAYCEAENHTSCSGNCQCWCHIMDFNQALTESKKIIKNS